MTEEETRVYSNEYADLLIEYSGDENILKKYQGATIQIIDYFFAVLRLPLNQVLNTAIVKMGYSVMPSIFGIVSHESIEASGIPKIRNIPSLNLRGQGVLIGILDTGIDYTNPAFRYADNTTKIVSIWDQTIPNEDTKSQSNVYYGTEYSREQINKAIQSNNPLEVVPSKDENGHGTMIAGIAAGREDPDNDFFSTAPDAELVIVKLKPAKKYLKDFWKVPENSVCYQENDILSALEYIQNMAIRLNRPLSLCVAIGTSQGAHDEGGSVTSDLSRRAESTNMCVVIAAGNEGNARRHYAGTINPDVGYNKVELNVGASDKNFSMELWGDSPGLFAVDIKTPSGEYIARILPRIGENRRINFIFERTIIDINFEIVESQSGDQLILMRFTDAVPGIWTFNVYAIGDLSLTFNIWLPMEGFISAETYFLTPDPNTTILSLGNGVVPITVTAYNPADNSIYMNASRGYTRTGVIKPEIAAPGVNIKAPSINKGYVEVTGTSPAAAHTAGVAAMLLEWAIVKGNIPSFSTKDAKILMIRGAKRDKSIKYPNKEWGYGRLDVYQIFNSLRSGIQEQ